MCRRFDWRDPGFFYCLGIDEVKMKSGERMGRE
jgi:hypothetical protein